jgi:hypothetical protein
MSGIVTVRQLERLKGAVSSKTGRALTTKQEGKSWRITG